MHFLRNILITVIVLFLLVDFLIVGYSIGKQYPDFNAFIQDGRLSLNISQISNSSENKEQKIKTYEPSLKAEKIVQTQTKNLSYDQATSLVDQKVKPKLEFDKKYTLSYQDEGIEIIDGIEMYRFSLGQEFPGHYRRYRHFAVPKDGSKILERELPSLEYHVIWTKD